MDNCEIKGHTISGVEVEIGFVTEKGTVYGGVLIFKDFHVIRLWST